MESLGPPKSPPPYLEEYPRQLAGPPRPRSPRWGPAAYPPEYLDHPDQPPPPVRRYPIPEWVTELRATFAEQSSEEAPRPVLDLFKRLWRWGAVAGLLLGVLASSRKDRLLYSLAVAFVGFALASLAGLTLLLARRLLPPPMRAAAPLVAGVAATIAVLLAASLALVLLPAVYQPATWQIIAAAVVIWVIFLFVGTRALEDFPEDPPG